MNEGIELYEELAPYLVETRKALEAWYDEMGEFAINFENRDKLTLLVYAYITDRMQKEANQYARSRLDGKTYNERLAKTLPMIEKLGVELAKFPTPKARLILELLEDVIKQPEEGIYQVKDVTASRSKIEDYLQKLGITKKDKETFFNIIRK